MAEIQGTDTAGPKSSNFKSSSTTPQGMGASIIAQAVVIDVNTDNWTVDVRTKFDRRLLLGVQVGSPYLHFNQGEGFYVMPEIGAKCEVVIPSDGSQPFVGWFIAPLEAKGAKPVTDEEGNVVLSVDPSGKDKPNAGDASFSAGRYGAKPGDIVARGRDGNFLILHRGGVVQIGSSSLSQRLFIPLGNLMMDVSERYAHHNSGGSVSWGIQETPDKTSGPTEFSQTFRVFANDKKAVLRLAAGRVTEPLGEADGDRTKGGLADLDIAPTGRDIVFELALADDGFDGHTNQPEKGARNKSKFRWLVDRQGGVFLRTEGNLYLFSRHTLRLEAVEKVHVKTELTSIETTTLSGKGTKAELDFAAVGLGPAGARRPVARQGDPVQISALVPVPVVLTFSSTPVSGAPIPAVMQIPSLVGAIAGGSTEVSSS